MTLMDEPDDTAAPPSRGATAPRLRAAFGRLSRALHERWDAELLRLSPEDVRPPPTGLDGFHARTMAVADLKALAHLTRPEWPDELAILFQDYLDEGHHGFSLLHCGRLVGYAFAFRRFHPLFIDNDPRRLLVIDLDERSVWLSAFVRAEHRRNGLPYLLETMIAALGQDRRYFTAIPITEQLSQQIHADMGFRRFGRVRCNRLLGAGYRWSAQWEDGRWRGLGRGLAFVHLRDLTRPSPPARLLPRTKPGLRLSVEAVPASAQPQRKR